MDEQEAWARQQSAHSKEAVWMHVAALLAQYDGMVAGYASSGAPPVPAFAWQLLNGVGDLFQIIPAVEKKLRPKCLMNFFSERFWPAQTRA